MNPELDAHAWHPRTLSVFSGGQVACSHSDKTWIQWIMLLLQELRVLRSGVLNNARNPAMVRIDVAILLNMQAAWRAS